MFRFLASLFCLLNIVCIAVVTEAARIDVKSDAIVRGPWVKLSDIAVMTEDVPIAFQNIIVSTAPMPGQTATLSADQLWLRFQQAGLELNQTQWNVPPSITIMTASQTVSSETIVSVALEKIKKQKSSVVTELVVTPLKQPLPLIAPEGKLELRTEILGSIQYSGPTTVKVSVVVNGTRYRDVFVQIDVKAYADIIVAAKPLNRYDTIDEQNVKIVKFNIAKVNGEAVTDLKAIMGLRLKRSITMDTPISLDLVELPPVVMRGHNVLITTKVAGISISARGLAMQNGSIGQTIRVQNVSSKKMLLAKVIGSGIVEVEIP